MFDAADRGENRTEGRAAGTAKAQDFPTDTIFLCGKGEQDKGGGVEGSERRRGKVDVGGTGSEAHISEAERGRVGGVGCVFAWAKQKEECKSGHVGNGVRADMW